MNAKSFRSASTTQKWAEAGHRFVVHQIYVNRQTKYRIYLETVQGYVSWLMARPPSLNPVDRIIAKRDRRFSTDFVEFEGPIDKARENGVVLIWDRGSCQVMNQVRRNESIASLAQCIRSGQIAINFEGSKLKGTFELQRPRLDADRWSIRKQRDRFAAKTPFYFSEESVVSETIIKEWLELGISPLAPTWREKNKPMTIRGSKSAQRAKKPSLALSVGDRREMFLRTLEKMDLGFRCSPLSKNYFSDPDIQKIDVLAYYYFIAPYILPHMKDRPIVLYRYPFGIGEKPIVERSIRGETPAWLRTVALFEQGQVRSESHVLADSERCLLFLANRSGIEMATWLSALGSLDKPRQMVIGLQADTRAVRQLKVVALGVRAILSELGIQSFCKATGVSGSLQIIFPLSGLDDFRAVHQFLKKLVEVFVRQFSNQISLSRPQDAAKVWLHFPGMGPGRAVIAPYSLRANTKVTVACPLSWEELESSVTMTSFTIKNIFHRLRKLGDPWFEMAHVNNPSLLELSERISNLDL